MLKFRPHHFFCALGFEGKGYSPEFVENFQDIVDRLRANEGDLIEILIVDRADSVCERCCFKVSDSCESVDKIEKLDAAHAQILRIQPGETLTWGNAKKLLAKKMTLSAFHQACDQCAWKALGMCESALRKLHQEYN